jgi:ABC-type multidrug transport system permease subunit
MMNRSSVAAIRSVAYKEFLHILRDRRVLILLLVLPPVFTIVFGHAFEVGEPKNIPALLIDRDHTERAQRFVDLIRTSKTFTWREPSPVAQDESDLLGNHVQATVIVPEGWSDSLSNGEPKPLRVFLDGSDTNTAQALEGSVQKTLGDFQMKEREFMIDALPQEVFDMAKKLPVEVRKQFASAMEPWSIDDKVLYNPHSRFIEYVIPGVIGLILQLITVTLMACTIARERESGTLFQLMVTALHRGEIVIGKIIPYLAVSLLLIVMIMLLTAWHFHVHFHQPLMLAVVCVLFLLCSLGMGLVISAVSKTQTQAIQFSVFFLLPVFVLSGAFAPIEQLPAAIRYIAEVFPLTHFCRAFRLVNMYHASLPYYAPSLIVLFIGAIVTFVGAAVLLKRIEQ